AGHRDLGGCTAAVDRDLLRLPVALDRVRCLAAEEPVQSHKRRIDGLPTEDSEAELAHTAELADSGAAASGGALSLALRHDGVEDLKRRLGELPRLATPGAHRGGDVLCGGSARCAGEDR